MTKIRKEAESYKDLPDKKLKKVIRQYKFLSMSNTEIFNFVFFLVTFAIPFLCIFGITLNTLFFMLLIHFVFYWEFLFKYKKFKLVSDEEKREIDAIVEILEGYLKENKKTPLVKGFFLSIYDLIFLLYKSI
jgi:hypothetical protein